MDTMTRSRPILRVLAVGLIGSFALGLGTITAAADVPDMPKATIRFADLDLATAQGAMVLYERIIRASYEVCQSFDRDRNDQPDPLAMNACVKEIIANAVTKVGKPALYAVYKNRNAKPLPIPIVTADSRK